ncbi:MAG: hypothetical protein Q9160_002665 [Pyrenula sp. 1 TL-2023]
MSGSAVRNDAPETRQNASWNPQDETPRDTTTALLESRREVINIIKHHVPQNALQRNSKLGTYASSSDWPDFNGNAAPNPLLRIYEVNGYVQLPLVEGDSSDFIGKHRGIYRFEEQEAEIQNPAFNDWVNAKVVPRACQSLGLTASEGFREIIAIAEAANTVGAAPRSYSRNGEFFNEADSSDEFDGDYGFDRKRRDRFDQWYREDMQRYLKGSSGQGSGVWLVVALPSSSIFDSGVQPSGKHKLLFQTNKPLKFTCIACAGSKDMLDYSAKSGGTVLIVYELRERYTTGLEITEYTRNSEVTGDEYILRQVYDLKGSKKSGNVRFNGTKKPTDSPEKLPDEYPHEWIFDSIKSTMERIAAIKVTKSKESDRDDTLSTSSNSYENPETTIQAKATGALEMLIGRHSVQELLQVRPVIRNYCRMKRKEEADRVEAKKAAVESAKKKRAAKVEEGKGLSEANKKQRLNEIKASLSGSRVHDRKF